MNQQRARSTSQPCRHDATPNDIISLFLLKLRFAASRASKAIRAMRTAPHHAARHVTFRRRRDNVCRPSKRKRGAMRTSAAACRRDSACRRPQSLTSHTRHTTPYFHRYFFRHTLVACHATP